jgi:N-acetylglucosamine-6-phosphate deacetylase
MTSDGDGDRPELDIAFVDAQVLHPDRVGSGECVLVRDGLVEHVGEPVEPPSGCRVVDVAGDYLLPGLVDIHAHGALGRTFNEPDPAAWATVLGAHLAAGTTSVLATLASDTTERMNAALGAADEQTSSSCVGAHLEGPYLSPDYCGAHPIEALRVPADGSWRSLVCGGGGPLMVTLAPELDGAGELIRALTGAGTVVSAGHSGASADVLAAAHRDGLRHIAHLWSGQSALHKDGPWRTPGLLEETLGSDLLTAEVIADGRHVPAPLVRIAHRCLGPDRLCLVSDASAGTGLPAGTEFRMGAAHGVVADGVGLSANGVSFCGSTSFLIDVLRYAVNEAGLPLVEAVRMATATPARVIGMADRIGALAPGRAADLLVLDRELRVRCVVQAGQAWQQHE